MKLNVSQLLEWQFCPVRWHHKYVSKRGVEPGAALGDGLYWHALAEAWLKGESLLPPSSGPVQDAMRHFVEEGNLPRLPVTGTEVALEMPLGRHTLMGILDGILPADPGRFYSLQWKTCAGGTDMERQCDQVKFSYHEAAYEALMVHHGYPCAGTYLGVWKKLTKGERAAGVHPLSFHILERPRGYVESILEELHYWAEEMSNNASCMPTPNRRSCIQGFMRCQYWNTCYEGKPLSDSSYIDLTTRYDNPEAE